STTWHCSRIRKEAGSALRDARSAIKIGVVDRILPLLSIGPALVELVSERRPTTSQAQPRRTVIMKSNASIEAFLAEPAIAVVGVSRSGKGFGNVAVREPRRKGYRIYRSIGEPQRVSRP